MKKIILTSLSCLALFLTGCSEDTTTFSQEELKQLEQAENENGNANRSGLLNGVIGEEINGEYVITVSKATLVKDLEEMLHAEGNGTKLKSLEIVQKTASNDPSSKGYMLVGSDNEGTSIGLWLVLNNRQFSRDRDLGGGTGGTSTTCRGCASGCNLSYLNVDGKKVAYCNENGCTYDCTKTETSD